MATLQITSFPAQVGVEEFFSIIGTAQDLAGQPLTLVIDNQYRMGAGSVPDNGLWSFRFRFTSSGQRRLVVQATDNRGQTVASQTIGIAVVNAPVPQLQITSFPYQVQREELCIINGTARGLDGRPLTLTVDDRFQSQVGNIPAGGNWSIRFRFSSSGNRKLVFSATDGRGSLISSPAAVMLVLDSLPPSLTLTAPQQVAVRQEFALSGTASGAVGQPVTLTIDNQFRSNAGTVAEDGNWQTQFQFLQAGTRRLTASLDSLAAPVISETAIITVVAASPRLTITPPSQPIFAGTGFALTGTARNFADGEQLVLRVEGQYILARPVVENQRWQAALFFNQAGKRRIELISSDQEKRELELTVLPVQSALKLFSRSIWTPTLTPEGLPDLLNPRRITLHHTVIANLSSSATQQQEIQRMRAVLNIHLNSSGYSDIGYHYIVMPSGRVYEARSSRKRGAHDLVNDGIGVAVDGDFQGSMRIGIQQYDAVVDACVMLCKRMGITDPITPVSTVTADFGTRQLSRICGHQDRVATGCPGTVYSRLPEIRRDVKQGL